MSLKTADLSDAHPEAQVAEPSYGDFGGRIEFFGPITTLKVFEDNTLVRDALEKDGLGRVLVVDGGGSMRCALVGGNLAKLGAENNWAGIIVNGCVRDSEELADEDLGVKALATHPRKSVKRGVGEIDVTVRFSDVTWTPGHFVYADEDGILVSENNLHE